MTESPVSGISQSIFSSFPFCRNSALFSFPLRSDSPAKLGEMSQRDKRGAPRVSGVDFTSNASKRRERTTDFFTPSHSLPSSRAPLPCPTFEGSRGASPALQPQSNFRAALPTQSNFKKHGAHSRHSLIIRTKKSYRSKPNR